MYNLEKNLYLKDRNNICGGNILFLCEYGNVSSVVFDSGSGYITAINMVGTNKFYRYDLPKSNLTFTNAVQISVPNACYVMNPQLGANLPGLQKSKMKLYDFLVRKSVIAIVRTNMNQYFVLGAQNGMDLESGSNFTSGKAGVELIGAQIKLSGAETIRITQIDPTLVDALLGNIVYVNVPMSLSATTISNTQIDLSWSYGDYENTGRVEVEISTDGINYTFLYKSPGYTTSYSILGLEEDTEYWFRIRMDDGLSLTEYIYITQHTGLCDLALLVNMTDDHEIYLTWDYLCYSIRNPMKIERSIDGTGYTEIFSTETGATSYMDTGLTFSTDYWYRIRMYLTNKYSRYSNVVHTKTLYYPVTITGTSQTDKLVNLSFDIGSWALNSVQIERSLSGTTGFTLIYTAPTGITIYTDSGLTYDTNYYYRARTTGITNSDYSSTLHIKTDLYLMNLTGQTITETRIDLGWSYGSYELRPVQIERSLSGTTGFTLIYTTSSGATTYSNTGLTDNTTYYYRVRTATGTTYSQYSNTISNSTKMFAPILSATTATNSAITITWSYGGAIQRPVKVEMSLSGNTGFTEIYTTNAGDFSFTATGLTQGVHYYFRTRTWDGINYSDYSNVVSKWAVSNGISLSGVTLSDTSVHLTWSFGNYTASYMEIERSLSGTTGFTLIYTTTSSSTSGYTDTGLTINTTYYYRIRINYGTDYSDYSNIINKHTAVVSLAGLVSYFKLDNNLTDETGFSQPTGTSITFNSGGKIGSKYLYLSTNGKGVTIVNNGLGKYDYQEYTQTAWVRTTHTTSQALNLVWYYNYATNNPNQYLALEEHKADIIDYPVGYNAIYCWANRNHQQANVSTNNPFADGVWFHIAQTMGSGLTGMLTTYVNGSLVRSVSPYYNPDGLIQYNSGSVQIGFTAYQFSICEVGFWSRCLSAADIALLYNNGNGVTYPFIV